MGIVHYDIDIVGFSANEAAIRRLVGAILLKQTDR
jgi:hypothetical protein